MTRKVIKIEIEVPDNVSDHDIEEWAGWATGYYWSCSATNSIGSDTPLSELAKSIEVSNW